MWLLSLIAADLSSVAIAVVFSMWRVYSTTAMDMLSVAIAIDNHRWRFRDTPPDF